jgi:hypothetical protein
MISSVRQVVSRDLTPPTRPTLLRSPATAVRGTNSTIVAVGLRMSTALLSLEAVNTCPDPVHLLSE